MKKILLLFIILNGFIGCAKRDECNSNAPATPVLTHTSVNETYSGSYYSFTNNIVSPYSAYVYTWISPHGISYQGSTLYYYDGLPPDGTWSVVAYKGSCHSDTAKFVAIYNLVPCAGIDTLVVNFTTYRLNFTGVLNQGGGNQQYAFVDPHNLSNILYINFYGTPTNGNYTLTQSSSYISQNQCYVSFVTTSDSYYSYYGTVNVNTVDSILYFSFCDLELENPHTGCSVSGYFKN